MVSFVVGMRRAKIVLRRSTSCSSPHHRYKAEVRGNRNTRLRPQNSHLQLYRSEADHSITITTVWITPTIASIVILKHRWYIKRHLRLTSIYKIVQHHSFLEIENCAVFFNLNSKFFAPFIICVKSIELSKQYIDSMCPYS